LSTKGRPTDLNKYLKSGADLGAWSITSLTKFADSVDRWWDGLQPAWRRARGENLSRIDRKNEGFEDIRFAGPEGLYLVVLALAMWGTHPKAADDDGLAATVNDVKWVLVSLNSVPDYSQKRAREEGSSGGNAVS
ncbi:hypothetical protein DFH11DRAFT_1520025, partial [Phellopilus nigrolimitatus]